MARSKGLTFHEKQKKNRKGLLGDILSTLFGVFAVTFIAVVLTIFLGTYTNVVGNAMEPSLANEQRVYIDKFSYLLSSPKKGDVVVFVPKGNKNTHYYVKRVIAVPGDTVLIEDGILYVNGERCLYVMDKVSEQGIVATEITLAIDEYFCMGDNPAVSEDSRSANVGPVKKTDIIGKAWYQTKKDDKPAGLISTKVKR